MSEQRTEYYHKYGLFILVLFLVVLNLFLFELSSRNSNTGLTFAMLDVGQGESLFIQSPTGTQVLIDGGPPRKILSQLSRVMPLFDRSIDAIIITNPDQDHIGGFGDVLKVYNVGKVFESGTVNNSQTYKNLKSEIKSKNIENTLAKKGMRLDIGGGAVIDILFPDRDVVDWTPNDGSVVAKLTYGATSIMLTGDSTTKTEKIILEGIPEEFLKSTVLKVGHHGSYTSSSEEFLKVISPQYAVISSGKENKYGHPHQEILDILAESTVFRTDQMGRIVIKSDGINSTFFFHR